MAPTTSSHIAYVSRHAERWSAPHGARSQFAQPLEGVPSLSMEALERLMLRDLAPESSYEASSTPSFVARSAETPPAVIAPPHTVSMTTAILAAILGALVGIGFCFFVYRWLGFRHARQARLKKEQNNELWGQVSNISAVTTVDSISREKSPYPNVKTYPVQAVIDTNPNWVPQKNPTWMRPLSVVYKQTYDPPQRKTSVDEEPSTAAPIAAKTHVSRPSVASEHDQHLPTNVSPVPSAVFPPAYVPGNRTPPVTATPTTTPAKTTAPVPPTSTRSSMKVRTTVPPKTNAVVSPVAEDEEHVQELNIPDFPESYGVPYTPRFSSLPANQELKSSAFDTKNFFPPTPVSSRPTKSRPVTAVSAVSAAPSLLPLPRLVTVIGTFQVTLKDELDLTLGETLRLLEVYGDDWCLVQRLYPSSTGRKTMTMEMGAVPILCLAEMSSTSPTKQSGSPTGSEASSTRMGSEASSSNTTTSSNPTSHWSSATTNAPTSPLLPSPAASPSVSATGSNTSSGARSSRSGASATSTSALISPPSSSAAGSSTTSERSTETVMSPSSSSGASTSTSSSRTRTPNRPRKGSNGQKRPIAATLPHQRNGSFTSIFDTTRAS